MIYIDNKFKTLSLYSTRVFLQDVIKPSVYAAFDPLGNSKKTCGMIKDMRKTIWIDLKQSEDEILMSFKSNTRNEVRKALREGYTIEKVENVEEFVTFYNSFASEKNLGLISIGTISKFPKTAIYKSIFAGKVLTMHASIMDVDNKIVRLLYSASVRLDEGIDRKSVGFSNRYLHYEELIEFKKLGYEIYDFGGINEDESNKEQYNITIFKKGFGGEVRDEIHLYSFLAWIGIKIAVMLSIRSKH